MKGREQFALLLRVIGLLGIVYIVRAFVRIPMPNIVPLVARVVCALIGVYLVRGAPALVKFAYPESTPETPEKSSP